MEKTNRNIENCAEAVIRLLQRLKDNLNYVLDKTMKDLEKIVIYEEKINENKLVTKINEILNYLRELYNKEKDMLYDYDVLTKMIVDKTEISPVEYLDYHDALLELGVFKRLKTEPEGKYLYLITERINKVTGVDVVKVLKESKSKKNKIRDVSKVY
jgi:hypothetical protein